MVLDNTLIDGSGLEFCMEIRKHTAASILFFATAGSELEIMEVFQAGGDYVNSDDLYYQVLKRSANGYYGALKTAVYNLRKKLLGSGYSVKVRRYQGYYFTESDAQPTKVIKN